MYIDEAIHCMAGNKYIFRQHNSDPTVMSYYAEAQLYFVRKQIKDRYIYLFTHADSFAAAEQTMINLFFQDSQGSQASPDSPNSPIYADFMKNAQN